MIPFQVVNFLGQGLGELGEKRGMSGDFHEIEASGPGLGEDFSRFPGIGPETFPRFPQNIP
ncbi:MAG: hypothetical protein N2C14_27995 [Planctomycetales bacterium]